MAKKMSIRLKLNRCYVIAILVLFLLYPIYLPNSRMFNKTLSVIPNIKQEDIDINLVFIGFNSEYILEDDLENSLPSEIDPFTLYGANMSFPHSNYEINYMLSYLIEEKTTALKGYIIDKADYNPLLGYRPNNTAIDEYISSQVINDFMDFYIPCSGYTVDAKLVEEYIHQNIHSDFEETSHYTLYLMNFSSIDAEDHSIEHSYVPPYVDCDSNRSTDISIAGTDQRNTVGWGGNYRFCYADLSALSEYILQYTYLLGSDLATAPSYYRYDLDTFTDINDIETTIGKEALATYVYEWINSYVRNVFISPALTTPPIYDTFNLPIKVFNNIADRGYPYESMSWAFNSDKISNYLSDAFPWIDWKVEFELDYLTDFPEIYNHLVDHTQNNGDYNYINLIDIVEILNEYTDVFYPPSSEYSQLPSYVLVFYNTYIQFGDMRIGGIAVGPYQIICKLPYLFFEDSDINKPIMGLTHIILHELGHNLGIEHPHNNFHGYGSMFIDDVESYIHCSDKYSVFSSDTIARFHFDYYFMSTEENLENIDYDPVGKTKVLKLLDQSRIAYLDMNYKTAVSYAMNAWKLSNKLDGIIRKPAVFWSVTTTGIISVLLIPTVIFRKNIFSKINILLRKLKR